MAHRARVQDIKDRPENTSHLSSPTKQNRRTYLHIIFCVRHYKELERALKTEKSYLSVKRAADLTHNMYQLNVRLPQSKHQESFLFRMSREQSDLYQIILKYYWGAALRKTGNWDGYPIVEVTIPSIHIYFSAKIIINRLLVRWIVKLKIETGDI